MTIFGAALDPVTTLRSHTGMVSVKVTVAVGSRKVAAEDVSDHRASEMLKKAGRDVGQKLSGVKCAVHGTGPTNVRIHFDKSGAADLQYESCCDVLGKEIGKVLG
jgi:hypothetical protein